MPDSEPFTTVDALRESLMDPHGGLSPAYRAKQLHEVPDFTVVDRLKTITLLAANETVLDVGGTGPLHDAIAKVAASTYVWDKGKLSDGVQGATLDLDDVAVELPRHDGVTLVVCGEVLEHLANPGHFLARLRAAYSVPKVFTVPNAHSQSGMNWLARGIENVNSDHVAWYSWHTLKILMERYGYTVSTWHWYNGKPRVSEGLLVITD